MRRDAILILLCLLCLAGCAPGSEPPAVEEPPAGMDVVATVGMLADAVENVGGDRVRVTALMGPGVDPHLYRASAGDLRRMTEADAVFLVGLHLEGKMAELLTRLTEQGRPVVAVGEDLPKDRVLILEEGAPDPHIWFSVPLWREVVSSVEAHLSRLDPDGAELYRRRGAAYRHELDELDAHVRSRIAELPPEQRVLITAHDAFHYFGREYGFQVKGLQGISTATEASTADVQALADLIHQRKLRAIFVESSVPTRNIEAVQAAVRARGSEVSIGGELFSDAMGDGGTPEGTYLGMVRHNVDTIVKALLGEGSHG